MEQQRHVPRRRRRRRASAAKAIYKPLRGERPLWDFEPGLHRRELAAYQLSEAMGIDLVPPTVIRDGPLGEGSLQWFVDADHQQHYFTIHETRDDLHDRLRESPCSTCVANNTDRKSGHVLIDADDHIWGIDHGLCFAADFKLRTVIWEFGGEPVPDALARRRRRASPTACRWASPRCSTTTRSRRSHERAQWVVDHPVLPVDTLRPPLPVAAGVSDDPSTIDARRADPPRRPRRPGAPGRPLCAARDWAAAAARCATGPARRC